MKEYYAIASYPYNPIKTELGNDLFAFIPTSLRLSTPCAFIQEPPTILLELFTNPAGQIIPQCFKGLNFPNWLIRFHNFFPELY